MSFGASPTDITAVVTRCKTLYRECRTAGGEYNEISHEVRNLHTVLRHLKYEVEALDSPLNHDRSIWTRQVAPTIVDCDLTLRQLDALLVKYASNGAAGGSGRPKFDSDEMDQMGAIRVKLISQKRSLTAFLDSIQLPQSDMAANLDNMGGQLDMILDKVDAIAERMGQRHDDPGREAWKQFRRELIAEGFSSEVLQQNEDVLRAYIREMDQEGLLANPPSDDIIPPVGPPPGKRQIEPVPAAQQDSSAPPRPPQPVQKDDTGTKEMLAREDNMKFPASMKFERRKPESRTEPPPTVEMAEVSRLPAPEEKDSYFTNADGSSEEDDDSDSPVERPKSPSDGEVIKTTELIALSQALTLRPQAGALSPGNLPYRPRGNEYPSSPSHPGAMPIPSPNAQRNGHLSTSPLPTPSPNPHRNGHLSTSPLPAAPYMDRLSTSPRPDANYLAPDQNGNEIPPDALWTKIDRRLVSLEVLAQDGRRFEARPEFVAVLGVLPRAEIQQLAARSATLRQARRARQQQQHQQQQQQYQHQHPHMAHQAVHPPHPHSYHNHHPPSPQPPRPSNFPRSMPTPRHSTSDSDHDREGHTSSESEYPHQPHHKDARPPRSILKKTHSYTHASHSPQSPLSPTSENGRRPPRDGLSNSDEYDRERDRDHRDRDRAREKEKDREREARRRERRDRERGREKEKEREREREKDKDKDKKKGGFKIGHRDVTAAGIGGAAMSLLTVLSEAAQGI